MYQSLYQVLLSNTLNAWLACLALAIHCVGGKLSPLTCPLVGEAMLLASTLDVYVASLSCVSHTLHWRQFLERYRFPFSGRHHSHLVGPLLGWVVNHTMKWRVSLVEVVGIDDLSEVCFDGTTH